jgi:7-cyano-7-deazaguanine tRNA-ribosyltransferase
VPFAFELQARDGAARLATWDTPHGKVTTPALLPVIHPGSQTIPAREMAERFGVQMVITNAYITWRNPALRERALRDGIRALIDFPGPVMTDSGTFQMYFYGKTLEVDNPTIVGFQRSIGSTVGTILDLFATPDMDEAAVEASVATTVQRAEEAQALLRASAGPAPFRPGGDDLGLALPVQGGVHPLLRERCARSMASLDAAVHPIGGVVPLMEGQRYATLVEVIAASQRGLPAGRPVHLFGAGHPLVFPIAALLGCDLFDSAAYSKFAQDGRYILPDGTALLAELEELPCPCPVCTATTARELRSLPKPQAEAALARHNLHVSVAALREVREAIRQGRLWELVERRCRAHPALLDALRAVGEHAPWIERREPLSKPGAWFYTGPETIARPIALRVRTRLRERYASPCAEATVVEDAPRPWGRTLAPLWAKARAHGVQLLVKTPFGPIPLELDQAYPFAQAHEPQRWDRDAGKNFTRALDEACAAHGWKLRPLAEVEALPAPEREPDLDAARVEATVRWQFGPGAAEALLAGGQRYRKSRKTGRVRNVFAGGEHVLSLRAADGLGTLKLAGGRRLHAALAAPRLRVVVDQDSAPFQVQGRNAFARFVLAMDPALRPGDECLFVDAADAYLGVGRVLLGPDEVGTFRRGVAAQAREGVGAPAPEEAADAGDAEDAEDGPQL